MKIHYLFYIPLFLLSMLCSEISLIGKAPAMPQPGTPEFERMMTEQMNNLDEFLKGKSEAEQKEIIEFLSDLGQQIIDDAKSKGYDDPFDYIAKELAEEMPDTDQPDTSAPAATPVPLAPQDGHTVESMQRLLHALGENITSLRTKTASSTALAGKVAPFKYRLDDLIYFLELFKGATLTPLLLTKEVRSFVEQLESLELTLSSLNRRLVVPEFGVEGNTDHALLTITPHASLKEATEAYHRLMAENDPARLRTSMGKEGATAAAIQEATQKAQQKTNALQAAYDRFGKKYEATQLVESMLDALAKATQPQGIIDGFKDILKKHEPTLLAQRQQQEKIEADARKQQETILAQRRPAIRDIEAPYYSGGNYAGNNWRTLDTDYGRGGPSFNAPGSSSRGEQRVGKTINAPSKPKSGAKGGEKKGEGKQEGKKEKKDKDSSSSSKKGAQSPDTKKGGSSVDKEVLLKVVKIENMLESVKEVLSKNKEDLVNFPLYLTKDIQDTTLEEAKKYQAAVGAISAQLMMISRQADRDAKSFKDSAKKDAYVNELSSLLEAFTKNKDVKLLINISDRLNSATKEGTFEYIKDGLPAQAQIAPAHRFIFFGIKPTNAQLTEEMLKLNTPENKDDAPINYIEQLKTSLENIKKFIKKNSDAKAAAEKPATQEEKTSPDAMQKPHVPDLPTGEQA